MNELWFLLSMPIYFSFTLIAFKFFGKTGLFLWISIAMIAANIEATKLINIFGVSLTLGNTLYGSTFLATDILCEKYGKEEAQKAVFTGFFTIVTFSIMCLIMLRYAPAKTDFVNDSLVTIFTLTPRVAAASILTYITMQYFDIWLFMHIRKKTRGKMLWLRNNVATLTTQLLDTIIFTLFAFWGVHSFEVVLTLIGTTYLAKFIISIADTPFVYIGRKITPGIKSKIFKKNDI